MTDAGLHFSLAKWLTACTMGMASLMMKLSSSVFSSRGTNGATALIYMCCNRKAVLSSLMATGGNFTVSKGDMEVQVVHLQSGSPHLAIYLILLLYSRQEFPEQGKPVG